MRPGERYAVNLSWVHNTQASSVLTTMLSSYLDNLSPTEISTKDFNPSDFLSSQWELGHTTYSRIPCHVEALKERENFQYSFARMQASRCCCQLAEKVQKANLGLVRDGSFARRTLQVALGKKVRKKLHLVRCFEICESPIAESRASEVKQGSFHFITKELSVKRPINFKTTSQKGCMILNSELDFTWGRGPRRAEDAPSGFGKVSSFSATLQLLTDWASSQLTLWLFEKIGRAKVNYNGAET